MLSKFRHFFKIISVYIIPLKKGSAEIAKSRELHLESYYHMRDIKNHGI